MLMREMNLSEYAEVIELIKNSVKSTCADDYSENEIKAWVPDNFDEIRFINSLWDCGNFVCTDKGKIIGFASIERDGYLNRLYVKEDSQSRGIGSALLERAENWAYEQGVRTITLDSSKTAESFYEKRGYVKSGISVMQRGDIIFRNTVMKKFL